MPGQSPFEHDAATGAAGTAAGPSAGAAPPPALADLGASDGRHLARRPLERALVRFGFDSRPHACRLGGARGRGRPGLFLRIRNDRRISV